METGAGKETTHVFTFLDWKWVKGECHVQENKKNRHGWVVTTFMISCCRLKRCSSCRRSGIMTSLLKVSLLLRSVWAPQGDVTPETALSVNMLLVCVWAWAAPRLTGSSVASLQSFRCEVFKRRNGEVFLCMLWHMVDWIEGCYRGLLSYKFSAWNWKDFLS